MTADYRKIVRLGAHYYPARSEHFLPAGEDVIQRVLKVRRGFGELATDLLHVFLVALLNLLLEELLECAIPYSFLALLWKVGNEIGHERSCESLRFGVGIVRQKRVDGCTGWSTGAGLRTARNRGCRGDARVRRRRGGRGWWCQGRTRQSDLRRRHLS